MERSVEYPRLAAFQSSEASWSIYRGFSYLHARVILELQEELRALEQELDEIDIDGDYEGESQSDNVNIRHSRSNILVDIQDKLMQYDEVLYQSRKLHDLGFRPSRRRMWDQSQATLDTDGQFNGNKPETKAISMWRVPYVVPAWGIFLASCQPVHAAPIPNPSDVSWKQQALSALTGSLVSCAFLVKPTIIILLCSLLATLLRYLKKDGSVLLLMLGLAAVFENIRTPSSDESGDEARYTGLATGLGYCMFMFVYCELIMLRNCGGKIFCFIALILGGLMSLIVMSFASVQSHWSALTMLDPIFALNLTIPMSFAAIDLVLHISEKIKTE